MGKPKYLFSAITLILFVALLVPWAFAGGHWGMRGYGYHDRGYGDHSNLSPEQGERLRARHEEFHKDPRGYDFDYIPGYGKGHMWRSGFGAMRGYGGGFCQ